MTCDIIWYFFCVADWMAPVKSRDTIHCTIKMENQLWTDLESKCTLIVIEMLRWWIKYNYSLLARTSIWSWACRRTRKKTVCIRLCQVNLQAVRWFINQVIFVCSVHSMPNRCCNVELQWKWGFRQTNIAKKMWINTKIIIIIAVVISMWKVNANNVCKCMFMCNNICTPHHALQMLCKSKCFFSLLSFSRGCGNTMQ